jgi:GNAT superfamily N-acetyltransferase
MPIVRPAVPSDANGIGQAHAEAWRRGYAELFPADQLEAAVDLRRRMWSGLVGSAGLLGTLLVADQSGEVAGFIHFGAAAGRPDVGEVYGFYVHPLSWGTGKARDLMDAGLTSMGVTFDRAVLWAHRGAGRARRFYAKSGWTETGSHRQETTWDGLEYQAVEYARTLELGT